MSRERQLSWSGNAEAKRQADEAWSRLRSKRIKRRSKMTPAEREQRQRRRAQERQKRREFKTEYEKHIHSAKWRSFKKQAREFYGNKCAFCGSAKRIHVHHKTYVNFGNELLEDVQLLCRNCHEVLHDRQREARRNSYIDREFDRIVGSF